MDEDVRSRLYNSQDVQVGEVLYSEEQTAIMLETNKQGVQEIIERHGLREEEVIDFHSPRCTIEEKLPCKVKTVLGFAIATNEENGLALPPRLARIDEEQMATVTDARAALEEWHQSVPAEYKEEAANWLEIFNDSVSGKMSLDD